MNLHQLYVVLSLTVLMGTSACKKRPNQTSTAKHTLGETARDSKKIQPCLWDKKQSINVVADQYLAKIAAYIADANPDTFQGNLNISNICIYLQKSEDINAVATPGKNKIKINSKILELANADADVASILSHELAHLTMQSDHFLEVPPIVINHPNWLKIRAKFESEKKKVADLATPLIESRRVIRMRRQTIELDWLASLPKPLLEEIQEIGSQSKKVISNENSDLSEADWDILGSIRMPEMSKTLPDEENSKIPEQALMPEPKPTATKQINSLKVRQDAVYAQIRALSPEQMKAWEETFKAEEDKSSQIVEINEKLIPIKKEFDDFIKQVAGSGASFNWKEQEADEVGYELYLRSSFEPKHMGWGEEAVMGKVDFEDCMTNNIQKKILPIRGKGNHPSECWRLYDLFVLEAEYHQKEYGPLMKVAQTLNIFSGELESVKKSL